MRTIAMDALISPRRRMLLQWGGAATLLAACGESRQSMPPPDLRVFGGFTMGTTYAVKLYVPGATEARVAGARSAVADALDAIVARMSTFDAASELSRFNAHASTAPFAVSPETLRVFAIAREVSEASGGAFDVTVAPAVNAWGFGPDKQRRIPAGDAQRAARTAIGYRGLALDAPARTVAKGNAATAADFSGIAKGWGVDAAAKTLGDLGFERYMVEISGEIRTRGLNADGRPWQIGIEQPDAARQRARLIVPLSDRAISTSGDYRIFFEQDGRRYCHEIDPSTGAPTAHALASVSVVADDSTHADAWATALYVLGPERGPSLAAARGLAAHFIVRGAEGFADVSTPAFAALGARAA
jgi:thiamine biosynthesis lipoprotein